MLERVCACVDLGYECLRVWWTSDQSTTEKNLFIKTWAKQNCACSCKDTSIRPVQTLIIVCAESPPTPPSPLQARACRLWNYGCVKGWREEGGKRRRRKCASQRYSCSRQECACDPRERHCTHVLTHVITHLHERHSEVVCVVDVHHLLLRLLVYVRLRHLARAPRH